MTLAEAVRPSCTVSVVIPCYNYGRFLGESIDSALRQSHPPVEIIVVDDGSTDETSAVAASYGSHVRYLRQRNGGPSSARNAGAKAAVGAYVLFLDADDVLSDTYIEHTLSAMTAADANTGFVYTQMRSFDRTAETITAPQFDLHALLRNNYIHVSALLPTALVRDVAFDERLRSGWEDWDFYLRLCERGFRGVLVDLPLLLYRRHHDGGSLQDGLGLRRQRKLYRSMAWRHRQLYRRRPLLLAAAIIRGFMPDPVWLRIRALRHRLALPW